MEIFHAKAIANASWNCIAQVSYKCFREARTIDSEADEFHS